MTDIQWGDDSPCEITWKRVLSHRVGRCARGGGPWCIARCCINRKKRSARLGCARAKGTHTEAEWLALLTEVAGVCPRCLRSGLHMDKDHVVPIYQGGSEAIDNIQPLCAWCNASKGPENTNWLALWREENRIGAT